jgi:hypothetical protein
VTLGGPALQDFFGIYEFARVWCFEARQLLREIGCAFGKAHNVIHLKGGVALPP